MIGRWLVHPLARGRDIDAPETTEVRTAIIQGKPFLRRIYEDWYDWICSSLPDGSGRVLEIGSGAGFLKSRIPDLITSEIFPVPGISLVLDACRMPLASNSLRAIVMTNVLHHIPCIRTFFREAARCVRPGGAIVMVEPWNTDWSSWVYSRLHHEPFEPSAPDWEFPSTGPLSGANGALPWILFERDRAGFEAEFPSWRVETVRCEMPFRYLLSGGMTYRGFLPGFSYGLVRRLEDALGRWSRSLSMFAYVRLKRVS